MEKLLASLKDTDIIFQDNKILEILANCDIRLIIEVNIWFILKIVKNLNTITYLKKKKRFSQKN